MSGAALCRCFNFPELFIFQSAVSARRKMTLNVVALLSPSPYRFVRPSCWYCRLWEMENYEFMTPIQRLVLRAPRALISYKERLAMWRRQAPRGMTRLDLQLNFARMAFERDIVPFAVELFRLKIIAPYICLPRVPVLYCKSRVSAYS